MKLDRNQANGRGKYGLIKNRVLHRVRVAGSLSDATRVNEAIRVLEEAGVIEWGEVGSPEEFFAIKLKDLNAPAALQAYAHAAHQRDPEYAGEVMLMAHRAAQHPDQKEPD